eukprot:TRINITY_DN57377_c0_g1_i1.p1 TRINITY_DN57377_c0_g1~~TRINITY_DN57377_c0_g1_i1.p1  ORF type:complete len:429 (-),score=36.66 TRINITY_DN57377_c0_g1_i1:42-1271(-)
MSTVPVGELACQKDSFAREITTTVNKCEKTKAGFDVVLCDTVLFPEGGGQPSDIGTLNDVPVSFVRREGVTAVHQTKQPLEVGTEVKVAVDWKRRFDNMQQHSGQHLITAVADTEFGYPTIGWHLGDLTSTYIELGNAKSLNPEKMAQIEARVNALIQLGTPVNTRTFAGPDELKKEFPDARSRGLPTGWEGALRVIEIQGVDINMCCGTHITNLSQLQAVKLLNVELKGEKGKLFFVVGDRVLQLFQIMHQNTQNLTRTLSIGYVQHPETVANLKTNYTKLQKSHKSILLELAQTTASSLLAGLTQQQKDTAVFYHRDGGGMEFLNVILAAFGEKYPEVVVVLTCVESGTVQFVVGGPADKVKEIGPKIAEAVGGRGGGKGKYQGKGTNVKNATKLEALLFPGSPPTG